jgi:hypothetical protein
MSDLRISLAKMTCVQHTNQRGIVSKTPLHAIKAIKQSEKHSPRAILDVAATYQTRSTDSTLSSRVTLFYEKNPNLL